MSLIPADQHFAVIAAILFLSAIAFASERTVVGQKITGTVVVILLAIVAANVGVIPHSAPAYGFIFSYIVPMLIPLFLFQADIRRLAREASRTTAAFLIATLGTVAGVIVAAMLLDLSQLGTPPTWLPIVAKQASSDYSRRPTLAARSITRRLERSQA